MVTRSVRIPDDIDELLINAAQAEHISVNAAIVQAVQHWIRMHEHRTRVRTVTAQVMAEDAGLLDRLGSA